MSTIFSCSTQLRCSESQVETFLARPRNTPSALAMNSRMAAQVASELAASQLLASDGTPLATAPSGAEQLRAIFCGLETLRQDQVRLLAYQRIVLEAKMAAMLERLEGKSEWGAEEGDLDMGTGGSEALQRLQRAVVDNQAELLRAVGLPTTKAILRAIWAPDMQEALKLSIMSEEESRDKLASTHDEYLAVTALQESGMENLRGGSISTRGASNLYQAQERAARLWRRRLWKITIPVRIDAKLRWATAHDDYDHKGNRSLANHLNRHNPDNNLSYCEWGHLGRSPAAVGSLPPSTLHSHCPSPPPFHPAQTNCRPRLMAAPVGAGAAPQCLGCSSRCWRRRGRAPMRQGRRCLRMPSTGRSSRGWRVSSMRAGVGVGGGGRGRGRGQQQQQRVRTTSQQSPPATLACSSTSTSTFPSHSLSSASPPRPFTQRPRCQPFSPPASEPPRYCQLCIGVCFLIA